MAPARQAPETAPSPGKPATLQRDGASSLARSEQGLRAIIENAGDGIMVIGSTGRILFLNPAAARIFGRHASDLIDADFGYPLVVADATEIDIRRPDGSLAIADMSLIEMDWEGKPAFVVTIHDMTDHKRAEETIRHQAHHDPLTTLPNRIALETRLDQSIAEAARNRRCVAVMFLDLDRFKTINDTLGHHVGDLLLVDAAHRLRKAVRSSDTVARVGGDEFVVVLPALEVPESAATVAGGIIESLARPFMIEGHVLHSSASIGVSIYPRDGDDVDTVMKCADTAMYHAKELGRSGFQFFSPELNRAAMARLELKRELRDALKLEQLVLHYQPRLARDGRITGVEALIRWNRPGHGLQSPDSFIPICEQSNLIVLIGEWVLVEVARQLRTWQDGGLSAPAVAINLSAQQLRLTGLPGQIAEVMRTHGLPAHLLEFEVTECMAMENPERASRLLWELRNMGLRLAVDDFGTGYSSLACLTRLPFDYLKIDRSFIAEITQDNNNLTIVRGTIALAHSLGLKVVAEGVETAGQLALLAGADCDEFQGYHFSRPLPSDELTAFLTGHPAKVVFR